MTELNNETQELTKLDYSEFNPEILAICSFFSFFVLPENIQFHKELIDDEAFTLFFGDIKDGEVSFDGVQSKKYYKLCEFFTRKNLWANKEDIKIKNSHKLSNKIINLIKKKKGDDNNKKRSGKTFIKVYSQIENFYYGKPIPQKVEKGGALTQIYRNSKVILFHKNNVSPEEAAKAEKCRAAMIAAIGFERLSIEQLTALSLAYGIVAEYGVDRIKTLKPWQAGKEAFRLYKKYTKRTFKKTILSIVWSFLKPILILGFMLTVFKSFF